MSEMIERVARVLCKADDEPWEKLAETAGDPSRESYRCMARGAIEAMREPIKEVMVSDDYDDQLFDLHRRDDAAGIWRTLIDRALA